MIKSVSTWLHAETALGDLYETPVWHQSQAFRLTEAATLYGAQNARSWEGVLKVLTGHLCARPGWDRWVRVFQF